LGGGAIPVVATLTTRDYDLLERAIARGQRLSFHRRGRTITVVPTRLLTSGRSEVIEARQPSTGETITISLDTVERIEDPR
jgi:hypothetical protein